MLPSVGARPNKLLSLEPPHRAARRMNKLCSRNTGLATAAGRSAHGSLWPRGFLSLRHPRSFRPASLAPSFFFSFFYRHTSRRYPCPRVSLSCSRRHRRTIVSPPFFSLFLSGLVLSCKPCHYESSAVSLVPRFFLASVNDSGVCSSSFLLRSLLRPRLRVTPRCLQPAESERARNSPLATSLLG